VNHIASLLALSLLGSAACSSGPRWEPSRGTPGAFRRNLVGDAREAGPFKYQLKLPAGMRVAAHKHATDMRVRVLRGSMFIILGEPIEASRAQHYASGSAFVIPAGTWHEEWWDRESVVEADGIGPQSTVFMK
jgi:hypothetical protein